jgi:hypothetical protein
MPPREVQRDMRNWLRMLAAILTGNLIYFAVLMKVLPPWLRHRPYHIDAGLLLDFILCVAIHVVLGKLVPDTPPGEAGGARGPHRPPDEG